MTLLVIFVRVMSFFVYDGMIDFTEFYIAFVFSGDVTSTALIAMCSSCEYP